MADTKNLCAQIPIALHDRVSQEKDRMELTTSQYITQLITEYYAMKENMNGGTITMTATRTMAFQIPEDLFQRIKAHLARESERTGRKLTQRDFVLGLIEETLDAAESSLTAQETSQSEDTDASTEEAETIEDLQQDEETAE